MEDIDRGVVHGEEFVDAENSVDKSTKSGFVVADPVVVEDGALAELETIGSGNQRMPSALML
jgi:hypothetical protein